jgi:hypothetical protein
LATYAGGKSDNRIVRCDNNLRHKKHLSRV